MIKKENYNDPVYYVYGVIFSIIMVILSSFGFKNQIYSTYDYVFNPFFRAGIVSSQVINKFFYELVYKPSILNENIELKKRLVDLERVENENKSLKEQLEKITLQSRIDYTDDNTYKLVSVTGIQNAFSSEPLLRIYSEEANKLKRWDPVYYEKGVLYGFVYEIYTNSADIVPFYSPKVNFNVPVRLLKDSDVKGFVSSLDKGNLVIKNVNAKFDIKTDEVWVTSNDVLEVPQNKIIGYTVGEVSEGGGFKTFSYRLPYSVQDINYLLIKT